MEGLIILSNPGSTSKKYSVYQDEREVAWFHIEKTPAGYSSSGKISARFEKKAVSDAEYHASLPYLLKELQLATVISKPEDIRAVSVRTVIPDPEFVNDVMLEPRVRKRLEKARPLDPLHIDPVLEELDSIREAVSGRTFVCLISDSTFHLSARRKIPLGPEGDTHTIGYHGLSCESVLRAMAQSGPLPSRIVIAHLGGGGSITAVRDGKSVYNSMDFSPLGGIVMSSRSGSVDPFLPLYAMKSLGLSYEGALELLYRDSGLKALSGISDDLRQVRQEALKGNRRAQDAIGQFADSVASYVALAATYSKGIDALVFTGTIGFRAPYVRDMVCERLSWLGISLDHDRNTDELALSYGISAHDSPVKVHVVHTDEMGEMHRHTVTLLKGEI